MSRVRRESRQTSGVEEVVEECVFFGREIEDPDQLRRQRASAIQ